LTFRDKAEHVFPPQAKRLAPDFFFQQQIYRHDGGTVLLAISAAIGFKTNRSSGTVSLRMAARTISVRC
jgi:hypothetical protein